MIQKNFDDIYKTDIDFLISSGFSEVKTLEYKQTLPGGTDKDKHEFMADVSSFANSSGGDIIYGIKEKVSKDGKKTGQAEKVMPLQGTTANEAKLRLEQIIRSGIEPRLPVHIKSIDGYDPDGTGFVILIRMPQSFASPHMIKSSSRFYCRNSAGKYQLDVQEIRNAFLATESQAERIRSFLQDRLAKIIADEAPIPLSTQHRLVLHILSLNSFFNRRRIDFRDSHNLNLVPIVASAFNHRYNLDGYLAYSIDRQTNLCDSYCQLFFNGTIEAVYAKILRTKSGGIPEKNQTAFIASKAYEAKIVRSLSSYFDIYKKLGIEVPVVISMALLGCKGAYMWSNYDDSYPIDRDVVVLPEVTVDNFYDEVPKIMKPIFDAVCNACGLPYSYNYTEDGTWSVR